MFGRVTNRDLQNLIVAAENTISESFARLMTTLQALHDADEARYRNFPPSLPPERFNEPVD